MKRFWDKVDKSGGADACWVWTACKSSHGYGSFRWHGAAESPTQAHRVAWVLTHGAIIGNDYVCHTCDNVACVNPAHLFLGSVKDNYIDMCRKKRGPLLLPNHTLSAEDLRCLRALAEGGEITEGVRTLLKSVLKTYK